MAAAGPRHGAGRLLHGRHPGGRRGAAPAGPGAGAGAAGGAVGFPRRPTRRGAIQAAEMLPLLEPALAFNHTLPVDLLQVLFALLDPWGVADKYRGFARLDPASDAGDTVRRAGGLAERRHSAGRAGGAGVPGGLVRRQHAGARRVADRRPAGGSRRAAAALPSSPRRHGTGSCRRNPPARWPALIEGAVLHEPAAGTYRHGRRPHARNACCGGRSGVAAGAVIRASPVPRHGGRSAEPSVMASAGEFDPAMTVGKGCATWCPVSLTLPCVVEAAG